MTKNDYRQTKAEVKILKMILNYIDEKDESDDAVFQEYNFLIILKKTIIFFSNASIPYGNENALQVTTTTSFVWWNEYCFY